MRKRTRILLLAACAALLFIANGFSTINLPPASAQGISQSPDMTLFIYSLGWYTPLTTNSNGAIVSAHYGLDASIGQTVIGKASSTHIKASLGYWAGLADLFRIVLPVLAR